MLDLATVSRDIERWIETFVEVPHPSLGGWAPCPYARKARLDQDFEVRIGGRIVDAGLIAKARSLGADDNHIHDTVLISAAFCMFNRYVDGLKAITPPAKEDYVAMGERMATKGYYWES